MKNEEEPEEIKEIEEFTTDCWLDKKGDELEAEGIDPGNIFEFHTPLGEDCVGGGLVVSSGKPGMIPRFHEIKIIYILLRQDYGKISEMKPGTPLFLSRWEKIRGELC